MNVAHAVGLSIQGEREDAITFSLLEHHEEKSFTDASNSRAIHDRSKSDDHNINTLTTT